MKNALFALSMAAALALAVGCTSDKMQSPHSGDCHATSQSQQSPFNSEDYVWEDWFFGANKTYSIESIDK